MHALERRGRLTLDLHLGVRLTVAVDVGGVADVLPRVLPPNLSQGQNATGNRVSPRQRRPEFGPGDDRRRIPWMKPKGEKKKRKKKRAINNLEFGNVEKKGKHRWDSSIGYSFFSVPNTHVSYQWRDTPW